MEIANFLQGGSLISGWVGMNTDGVLLASRDHGGRKGSRKKEGRKTGPTRKKNNKRGEEIEFTVVKQEHHRAKNLIKP